MNRNIKFRIWDTFTKKMVATGYHVIGETTCFQMVEQWAREYPDGDKQFLLRLNDFVEMQFTGLKDKNNKEIYEGDIIDYQDSLTGFCGVGKVEFGEGAFGVNKTPLFNLYDRYVEILGNIFENSDLLK